MPLLGGASQLGCSAKHGYAHARLDKQLQKKSIEKRYFALVKGDGHLEPEGEIIAPIARDEDSIITRRVAKGGKYAHTSYKIIASYGNIYLGKLYSSGNGSGQCLS